MTGEGDLSLPDLLPGVRLRLDFFVDGVPITQGSKKGFVVNDKRTGKARAVVVEDRSASLGDWRRSLSSSAALAMDRADFAGYVELPLVELDFGLTKPATVKRRYPTVKPDVDKLARAVLDALTAAGVYKDDAAVLDALIRKRYSARPGVRVRVYELEW
jgi:Holliday junction resolvase RusA-like endonuclease